MKKKALVAAGLVMTVAASLLAGCGGSPEAAAASSGAAEETAAVSSSAETAETSADSAAEAESAEEGPVLNPKERDIYVLQDDSYEATETEGGYRHYKCEATGDEYSYETDPLVYTVNPKTGEEITVNGKANPVLPEWEHVPDGEPAVYWSKEDDEWRVYLYGSHDLDGTGMCSKDYVVWSAPVYDMSDWRLEGTVTDINNGSTYGGDKLFAPDCAYDLQTDTYYMISNQMYGNSVLRASDSPAGPWDESEAEWLIETNMAYDPSIYIEDGTIYITGAVRGSGYEQYPEIAEAIAADEYSSGMKLVGAIFQLKKDLSDGDGIEAISWLPNDERIYLPIFEGPSLDYIEELGAYIFTYVSNDIGADGTSYNSTIGYVWTDDLMNGTWHYGDNGVEETYPELDYLISGNRGNIISDTSGRYSVDPATGEMTFSEFPTHVMGNNHGGIARINGQWYYFGHRQITTEESSRQAIAGRLTIEKNEAGEPLIRPMEYTSSGMLESLDAFAVTEASSACYLLEAIDHQAPSIEDKNPHSDCIVNAPYITTTRDENATYAAYVTNLKNGSIAGYKYLDFAEGAAGVKLLVSGSLNGSVEIWLDAPAEEQGGTRIGSAVLSGEAAADAEKVTGSDGTEWSWISAQLEEVPTGVHGVYFVFSNEAADEICSLAEFVFE